MSGDPLCVTYTTVFTGDQVTTRARARISSSIPLEQKGRRFGGDSHACLYASALYHYTVHAVGNPTATQTLVLSYAVKHITSQLRSVSAQQLAVVGH